MLLQSTQNTKIKDIDDVDVSIIILFFNELHYVDSCLQSTLNYLPSNMEIIVVDNGSSDGTQVYIHETYPDVTLIRSDENLGYSGGNNLGVINSKGEYLVFLNGDTSFDSDWISPLINVLQQDSQVGIVNPKILLRNNPEYINACGLNMHYTGLPGLRGWMHSVNDFDQRADLRASSGAAFAMRRSVYDRIGGLDDHFFPIYMEDVDLSWRLILCGYRCVYIPDAVLFHDYTPDFKPNKFRYLEQHRYRMILKNYRWRTMILMIPALVLAEVISWTFALLNGAQYLIQKITAYVTTARHFAHILESRRQVQAMRTVSDRSTFNLCTYHLSYRQVSTHWSLLMAGRFVDTLFLAWLVILKFIVRW